MTSYYSSSIGATAVGTTEVNLAGGGNLLPYPPGPVRIRGHVDVTGNAAASTVTVNVRKDDTPGTLLYTSGAITFAAAAKGQIVFECEDDSEWMANLADTGSGGAYGIFAVASLAGNVTGGYVSIESIN